MRAFVLGSVLLLASAASGYYLGNGPADTPEVAAAKAAHFAAHAAVKTGHGPVAAPVAAHWDHHAPAQKAWHGPIHIPVIHKGVPVEPKEVQHAKAEHAAVKTGHGPVAAPVAAHWDHHAPAQKAWHGPIHIPVIHKGVPVEPKEVQHAKAEHAAAYAKVQGHQHHYAPAPQEHYGHHHEEAKSYGAWHGPQHVPVIHNGVPVETPEVQHAKAAHLNALASAGAHSGYSAPSPAWGHHGAEDDGSYDPAKYERADY